MFYNIFQMLLGSQGEKYMRLLFLGFIYLMFLLSGAAALMYQVIWVRSLTLIFGGSHLAVTTVLSVFMFGLALGGYFIGKYADRVQKPLRLYGLLEIGIALFAMIFVGLTEIYPAIYTFLTHGKDHSYFYLFFVRTVFSVVALIMPTVFMGGTLPVLSRFISKHPERIGGSLSFLYSFNTLGAVLGAITAGYLLLPVYSVSTTLSVAVLTNLTIGLMSILLQGKAATAVADLEGTPALSKNIPEKTFSHKDRQGIFSLKLVIWGIGVSGFCALGYEVLWTRILTMVVGASVYGFTTMLIAFLIGIALGSGAYGLLPGIFRIRDIGIRKSVFWFGAVQVIIGIIAFLVNFYIRDLPINSLRLKEYFSGMEMDVFEAMQWANLSLAFLYMVVPAFFMGVAFPLAGKVHTEYKRLIGSAVGEVLAYNTIGAVLGAALSGYVMIYLFGIEKSLQMLTVVNTGFGLFVIISLSNKKALNWAVSILTAGVLLLLSLYPDSLRMWNKKYFAIFRANHPEAFRTLEIAEEAMRNTDVLYYHEGVEATISSIKIKGGTQAFLTNGRVEASDDLADRQLQFTLGHLPMLLTKNPRKVLVIGVGSGMTVGSTSVHPEAEKVTLVEIERGMLGVAKTFKRLNHNVLDNPKLKVIFNDGRNFLLSTKEKFDVITADPIHPWFRGAAYLYTSEYFKLASERLNDGGVMSQWLPIYELTTKDLQSVVKTFNKNFKYTMLFLTYNDSVIIGSNSPIRFDEADLDRRIADPAVYGDLEQVDMASAKDLLSYFAFGTEGMNAFGETGIINTDDNLYLEFSAPLSMGKGYLMRDNANIIAKYRNSIIPYLIPTADQSEQDKQIKTWDTYQDAARIYDRAHVLLLGALLYTPEYQSLLDKLDKDYPWYAPGKFLRKKYLEETFMEPKLLQKADLTFLDSTGIKVAIEISAVLAPISKERASVVFVNNAERIMYGQIEFDSLNRSEAGNRYATEVLTAVNDLYKKELQHAQARNMAFPQAVPFLRKMRDIITQKGGHHE